MSKPIVVKGTSKKNGEMSGQSDSRTDTPVADEQASTGGRISIIKVNKKTATEPKGETKTNHITVKPKQGETSNQTNDEQMEEALLKEQTELRERIKRARTDSDALKAELTDLKASIHSEEVRRTSLRNEYVKIKKMNDLPDEQFIQAAKEYMRRIQTLTSCMETGCQDAEKDQQQLVAMSTEEFVDPVLVAPLAAEYETLMEKLVELHDKLSEINGKSTERGDERTNELSKNKEQQ